MPRSVLPLSIAAAALVGSVAVLPAAAATPAKAVTKHPSPTSQTITSTGLKPGEVKHVWLIILENKGYDATFTGLNRNDYLWKTLPKQGVLLKNYYGTGHFSMDNYISMVSGQGAEQDTQNDCSGPASNMGSDTGISDTGKNGIVTDRGVDYGQVISQNGPNVGESSTTGTNGCVYPLDTPTLFNQLNGAGVTWKGYAQDLGAVADRERLDYCGYPGGPTNNPDTNPTNLVTPTGDVTSFTGTQPNDQYVAKHFPFPWFHSLLGGTTNGTAYKPLDEPKGGTNCDANHIANLDDAAHGLVHDLKSEATTPAFSWITPNNCSDAHDQICKGNNLSGAFTSSGAPNYTPSGLAPDQPQLTTPTNATGGLYASDLFLRYYIPLIESSAAFKDGGLIDITFDEANPPFTYSGNSFNNANAYGPTEADKPDYTQGLLADAAGENIAGKNVSTEPTGPMAPLKTDSSGNQLYPGPGDNAFIDRPSTCTATPTAGGCFLGGGSTPPGPASQAVSGGPGSSIIADDAITAKDTGRIVTDTTDTPNPLGSSTVFVGQVQDSGPLFPASASGKVVAGSFQLVDASGDPVTPTGPVTKITLSGEEAPNTPGIVADGKTADPLYDATDPTPGGGPTGSVLIGPSIKPGTVSTTYYNHYSWLRTMEDIFGVSKGTENAKLTAGTVSGGMDGKGHLGFAAQPGLRPFGPDVFTNEKTPKAPPALPQAQAAAAVWPRVAGGLGGGALAALTLAVVAAYRRRRSTDRSPDQTIGLPATA
jgi:hypothetical protein